MIAAISRDVVRCDGADAERFLQGQLSQDMGMAVGESRWSLLLQPQGKVEAWVRVTRLADHRFVLDVDAGWGSRVIERLDRFRLRVDAELSLSADVAVLAVREAAAPVVGEDVLSAPLPWVGADGGEGVDLIDLAGGGFGDVVADADAEALDAWRVAHGIPAMGHELDDTVIPAEAGPRLIEASVSFTKGCYVGQELVARIDARGSRTPRMLRSIDGLAGVPAAAADVEVDGAVVGGVTSSGVWAGHVVALAYVGRAVEPPSDCLVGGAPATVAALP